MNDSADKMTDVHQYDGQLPPVAALEALAKLSSKEKEERLAELGQLSLSVSARFYLKEMIAAQRSPANYDPTNRLWVDDLLALSWTFRKRDGFLSLFQTQLEEMETGFCPQGRTHRLYQLVIPFLDSSE